MRSQLAQNEKGCTGMMHPLNKYDLNKYDRKKISQQKGRWKDNGRHGPE